jgi:hypothetical protein
VPEPCCLMFRADPALKLESNLPALLKLQAAWRRFTDKATSTLQRRISVDGTYCNNDNVHPEVVWTVVIGHTGSLCRYIQSVIQRDP